MKIRTCFSYSLQTLQNPFLLLHGWMELVGSVLTELCGMNGKKDRKNGIRWKTIWYFIQCTISVCVCVVLKPIQIFIFSPLLLFAPFTVLSPKRCSQQPASQCVCEYQYRSSTLLCKIDLFRILCKHQQHRVFLVFYWPGHTQPYPCQTGTQITGRRTK